MTIEHEIFEAITRWLELIIKRQDQILVEIRGLRAQGKFTMATIDQLVADVESNSTLEGSVLALLTGVQSQLASALSGETLPPSVQAKVDSAFATLEAGKAKLVAAVPANTPAAPPTDPTPTLTGSTGKDSVSGS